MDEHTIAQRAGSVFTRPRLLALAIFALAYVALFFVADGLQFEPTKDEVHFWPTSQYFAKNWPPDAEVLRSYRELNTPLPFIVYGALEHYTGAGIAACRGLNLLLSFLLVSVVLMKARGSDRRVIASVVGILSFPYFIGVSIHLYTDLIAAALAFAGIWCHRRSRYVWAGACFTLAIASRQYMVAFPAAVFLDELRARWRSPRLALPLAMPALAVATLFGWYLFFGDFGPRGEIERQVISTAKPMRLMPSYVLYFLAVVGAYFVIPEFILHRRKFDFSKRQVRWLLPAGALLALLFVFFPPLRNVDYGIPTMGFLDKAAHRVLPATWLRMAAYWWLAVLAILRFRKLSLASLMVAINALLMLKAHIVWDKYALALFLVLWFLEADEASDAVGNDSLRAPPLPKPG